MQNSTTQLHEKYRPKQWSEVVGQEKVIAKINHLRGRTLAGLAGRAFWLSGKSGTGKTSIARLIAADVSDELNTYEIDAGTCTVEELRRIEGYWALYGMGEKTGRAFIVNEAHGLKAAAIRQLLVMLERMPGHCVMIFTTTIDGENLFEENMDSSPMLSRCVRLDLAQRDLAKAFAERAAQIAASENLGSAPIATIVKIVNDCRSNFRAVLQSIEAGALLA